METASTKSVAATGGAGPLINRNYALLWSGQAISNVGDYVFSTALVLWIGAVLAPGQAWAPLAVSGVLAAQYVPPLLVAPVAGVFVDRWPKRPTMVHMDALRATVIGALVIVPMVPNAAVPPLWKVAAMCGAVFIESAASQFYGPARFTLVEDVVDEPHRAQAIGLSQATLGLAVVVGPALAALLVFTVGVEWALAGDALSFVVALLTVLAIQPPASAGERATPGRRRFLRELRDGLRVLTSTRPLVAVLAAILFSMLGLGTMMALGYFFLTENLHAPAALYGALSATFGIGAIVAGATYSLLAQRINMARLLWISMLALGVVMVLLARAASVVPAFGLALLFGPAFAGVNVATGPLVMSAAPREFVGRVSSALNPVESLATLMALVGAGYLDSTVLRGFHRSLFGIPFGPVDTCFTLAGIVTFIGGLLVFAYLRGHPAAAEVAETEAGETEAGETEGSAPRESEEIERSERETSDAVA